MVEKDLNLVEVLEQITSVTKALCGVWIQVVADHLRGCVPHAAVDNDDELIDELIEHLVNIH